MPNVTSDLDAGRQIFRQLRLAGCGFTLSDSGKISTTGETPSVEMLAEANAHIASLGIAIAEICALENLLRRRLREGSAGTSIARAILAKDPANDLAILALRDAPDTAGAIFDCLRGMGLTLARSADDAEKVSITGPEATLATACGPTMRQAVAAHRVALLARIDQAAVEATATSTSTKPKMTARAIARNPASRLHAIQFFHVALNDDRCGLRATADGRVEAYGKDRDAVERFVFDGREGLNDDQMQVLAKLLSDMPLQAHRHSSQ